MFKYIFKVRLVVITKRGDRGKVTNSQKLSTKFLKVFLLFFFSVDSQWFIAEDFFSISRIERGKRSAKHQFQADLAENQARKRERESRGRITRESIEGKHRETYSPLQEIYSIHARHLPGDYQNRFGTLSTVVSCSILLSIPETCQANNILVRFGAIPDDQASDSNKRFAW